jgi:hypothetical protein
MKLIQDNPYRIAGILANASSSEFDRQKSKILRYAPLGRQVESDFDFSFLNDVDRTNVEKVKKAFVAIEQREEKVRHSIFWFINVNPFDKTAIDYLINGDKDKAIDIWKKKTDGKEVTSKNFSCFNNIGTLKLLSSSKDEIKEGLEAKIKLIESPSFSDFVLAVADQTYTIDNQKQTEKFVDDVLKQLKGKYSSSDTLELFSNCNGTTQKYLTQKFTEEPIHKIERQIETCKKKRKDNKLDAYNFGMELYTSTKEDLSLLKSITGISDLNYKALADQLANEIMQCGIDYFYESQENNSRENYLESAEKLTKLAESIAVGKMTKDRAKDSLESLEDMKDQEINKAIAILNSIKLAYEKACREIDKQVEELEYFQRPGWEGGAPMRLRRHDVSINWSKVAEMKANCLDWVKVTQMINDEIPEEIVSKIKYSKKSAKLEDYKNLVNWILTKLIARDYNKVKYLNYWSNLRDKPKPTEPGPEPEDHTWKYVLGGVAVVAIMEYAINETFWVIGILIAIILVVISNNN